MVKMLNLPDNARRNSVKIFGSWDVMFLRPTKQEYARVKKIRCFNKARTSNVFYRKIKRQIAEQNTNRKNMERK